jgi:hypothetical protein
MATCDADWENAFGEMERVTIKIRDKTNELIDKVNHLPLKALNPQAAGLVRATKWLAERIVQLMNHLEPRFNEPGNPCQLRRHALAWTKDVGAKVGVPPEGLDLGRYDAETKWKGVASDAYRGHILPQKNACVAFKATTEGVATALQSMAGSIIEYWIEMAVAAVALAAAIVTAILGIATVIAALKAVILAAIAAGVCAAAMWAAEWRLKGAVSDNNLTINQKTNDPALNGPNGSWPSRFNVDLSDGSVEADGSGGSVKVVDDTDWHLK